ncbi:MAG: permease prefix domain 1-containing protein, partial [Chloroflexi bacterium]|nr:permease prefix domain 1-containing protein [Chloroflexota bacterium]
MDTYQMYLRTLQQGLKLDPEETRTVMAEVRGNLDDLAAHLRAQGYAADDAAVEAVRRFDDARGLARDIRRARRGAPLPLQFLALLLGAVGVGGLVIAL